ncbi:hypothetical protein KKF32_05360 [Patescibacteria group bacterium]|nr:hypothetical protein [Patescibacteria group bacterium]
MEFKVDRYREGRPHPDHINDIMHRVIRRHLSEKRRNPRSIIPLYQVKLEKEIGTTRVSLDKGFQQYVGKDLKVLDPTFEGLKIVKTPTVYVLDDDFGELLLYSYGIGGEEIAVGLCTSCGKWTQTSIPVPEKIACDSCGLVYTRADNKNLNLNSECETKQKYGASDIVCLIDILENDKMDHETRLSAGIKIRGCCSSESEIMGGKNDLRPFLISILDNFESINFESNKGIVFTQTKWALWEYVAFQLQSEEDIQWMRESCYPRLENLFEKISSIKGRNCILRILSQIYRTSALDMEQCKLTTLLRKKFFDPKEDGSIAIDCWSILLGQADDELKAALKAVAFSLAKSWETFCSLVGLVNGELVIDESEQTEALPGKVLFDELKEMLEDMVSNITSSEKEILEKRGLEVMKKFYNF